MIQFITRFLSSFAIVLVFLSFVSVPVYHMFDQMDKVTENIGDGSWIKEHYDEQYEARQKTNLDLLWTILPIDIIVSLILGIMWALRARNDDRAGGVL